MSAKMNIVAASMTTGVLLASGLSIVRAEDNAQLPVTIKPISGEGAAPHQFAVLSFVIGKKQTLSYFQNETGICKLTVMVGEAFNGVDIPTETTARFDVGIHPSKSALLNMSDGKGVEFTCLTAAQGMSVKSLDRLASY
jgi:hypothetical protein